MAANAGLCPLALVVLVDVASDSCSLLRVPCGGELCRRAKDATLNLKPWEIATQEAALSHLSWNLWLRPSKPSASETGVCGVSTLLGD